MELGSLRVVTAVSGPGGLRLLASRWIRLGPGAWRIWSDSVAEDVLSGRTWTIKKAVRDRLWLSEYWRRAWPAAFSVKGRAGPPGAMWVRTLAIVVKPSCRGVPRFPGRISFARRTMRRPALQLLANPAAWPVRVAVIPTSTAFAVAAGSHWPFIPNAPAVAWDLRLGGAAWPDRGSTTRPRLAGIAAGALDGAVVRLTGVNRDPVVGAGRGRVERVRRGRGGVGRGNRRLGGDDLAGAGWVTGREEEERDRASRGHPAGQRGRVGERSVSGLHPGGGDRR